jgi:hypothetical protein
MKPNGPAIWGGCVTRRRHRVGSWYFSQIAVTVQEGYGTCFCHPGTNYIEHYACRGTNLVGAGKLSRCRIFIGGTGVVSRYKLSRSQKSVTVHDFNWGAGARVRVHIPLKSCLGSRSKSKNRDKQLNHIVRVSFSSLFNDLAVRVLSAVPDSVDNDLILSNLIVDYVIFNY